MPSPAQCEVAQGNSHGSRQDTALARVAGRIERATSFRPTEGGIDVVCFELQVFDFPYVHRPYSATRPSAPMLPSRSRVFACSQAHNRVEKRKVGELRVIATGARSRLQRSRPPFDGRGVDKAKPRPTNTGVRVALGLVLDAEAESAKLEQSGVVLLCASGDLRGCQPTATGLHQPAENRCPLSPRVLRRSRAWLCRAAICVFPAICGP